MQYWCVFNPLVDDVFECRESWLITRGRTQSENGDLDAPNSCRVDHNNNIIVSGEAVLSAVNAGKPLGGRGSALNPAGELTAHPRPPGGEGLAVGP